MCKVSIIIPVYNAAKTINKCIDSILNQTYTDFEIIAINDGSKDNSLELLKKYSDRRMVVINQKNMGVSVTRNNGIKKASGEYIVFVDNDDYLENDFLEQYINNLSNEDLIIGGYKRINKSGKIMEKRKSNSKGFGLLTIITPWAKMYKKDLLIKNNISFLSYGIGEDIYFYLQVLSKTNNIKTINNYGYIWFYNEKSVSNTKHKGFNSDIDILYLIKELRKKIDKTDFGKSNNYNYFMLKTIIWYLLYSGKTANKKEFLKQYDYLYSYIKREYSNYFKILFKIPKGELFKNKLIIRLFTIIEKLHLVKLFAKFYCKG